MLRGSEVNMYNECANPGRHLQIDSFFQRWRLFFVTWLRFCKLLRDMWIIRGRFCRCNYLCHLSFQLLKQSSVALHITFDLFYLRTSLGFAFLIILFVIKFVSYGYLSPFKYFIAHFLLVWFMLCYWCKCFQ